jgi:hypothetical protein
VQQCAELIQRKGGTLALVGRARTPWTCLKQSARRDLALTARARWIRPFAALVEKSTDVAVKRLDTHFIDLFGEPPDI